MKKMNKTCQKKCPYLHMDVIAGLYHHVELVQYWSYLQYCCTDFWFRSVYYVILAVSLNLTVGVLGELSLGHAGFMCVGAFTSAFLYKVYGRCDYRRTCPFSHGPADRCSVQPVFSVFSSVFRYCA